MINFSENKVRGENMYTCAMCNEHNCKTGELAHNPIGALYLSDGYYENKLYK